MAVAVGGGAAVFVVAIACMVVVAGQIDIQIHVVQKRQAGTLNFLRIISGGACKGGPNSHHTRDAT